MQLAQNGLKKEVIRQGPLEAFALKTKGNAMVKKDKQDPVVSIIGVLHTDLAKSSPRKLNGHIGPPERARNTGPSLKC